MKAFVTLTYKVTVVVEGDDIDQITSWAYEHTPSEAADDARKNGKWASEDYDEYVEKTSDDIVSDIKIN